MFPDLTQDNDSILARANSALIRYPLFKELHEDIQRCQRLSRLAGEPQCMCLEGVTGAGKTTLVRDYAAQFSRTEEEYGFRVPVFYLETPSPVTVKGMAAAMLEKLGDPAPHAGTQPRMNSRLISFLIACRVELVILDDFQHLIDTQTDRVIEKVSDWLKVLIKETGIPFLVLGIEGKVERILISNPQLSRLFATRQILYPFQWDTSNKASIATFERFIEYAQQATQIPFTDNVPHLELLYRLHYATDGIVGNVMNLLRFAAALALERKQTSLDLALLSSAFDKRLAKHMRGKINPFNTPAESRFTIQDKSSVSGSHNTSSSHVKKSVPDASQILKTR